MKHEMHSQEVCTDVNRELQLRHREIRFDSLKESILKLSYLPYVGAQLSESTSCCHPYQQIPEAQMRVNEMSESC